MTNETNPGLTEERPTEKISSAQALERLRPSQVKWGVLYYVAGLVWIFYLAPDGMVQYLWDRQNVSHLKFLDDALGSSLFLLVLAWGLVLGFAVFAVKLYIFKNSLNKSSAAGYVLARLACVVLGVMIWFQSMEIQRQAERRYDRLGDKALARLKIGMNRKTVERLILVANVALVDKVEDRKLTAQEKAVLDAWDSSEKNPPIDFSKVKFARVFFNLNNVAPSKLDPKHRFAYVKSCCLKPFAWKRYDLFIEYDRQMKLKSVRYLKSSHADAVDSRCRVRFELPRNLKRQYPYPCPKDVQEF